MKRNKKEKKRFTFDRKIIRFLTWTLTASAALIISVSVVSTVMSLTNKSAQLAMKEVEVMAADADERFRQYYGLIWAILLDSGLQSYMKAEKDWPYYLGNANTALDYACNTWENINFISIIRKDGKDRLVKGYSIPFWKKDFEAALLEDYKDSVSMGPKAMRMTFTNAYDARGEYTLNIYYPFYSGTEIGRELGLLCLNVDDAGLSRLLAGKGDGETFAVNTYFIHSGGKIIAETDPEANSSLYYKKELEDNQEITATLENVIIYKKLTKWNFYYVSQISWWDLAKDSMKTVAALGVILTALIVLFMRFAKIIVTKAYKPWGEVVHAMRTVSNGEMEIRLGLPEADPDMEIVSEGFNHMMDKLIQLMAQMKEDQHQMEQIRLKALYSQIQPHFLYNTLDCIRWQAVLGGNQDVSNMVKALAAYYRLCLSKGKDIITLEEELQYVKNYLYIQQIRYGEILRYEICPDKNMSKALIPKLTLQPLVENAIYHGIKSRENQQGNIKIRIRGGQPDIWIEVWDDGIGMTKEEIEIINRTGTELDDKFGYGVRNVNRRLQLFFGAEYGLMWKTNETGGVTVTIRIPYILEHQEKETLL